MSLALWIAAEPQWMVPNSAQPWRPRSIWGPSNCRHLYLVCQRELIFLLPNFQRKYTELQNRESQWTMTVASPWTVSAHWRSLENVLVQDWSATSRQQGAAMRLWKYLDLNKAAWIAVWFDSVSHCFNAVLMSTRQLLWRDILKPYYGYK